MRNREKQRNNKPMIDASKCWKRMNNTNTARNQRYLPLHTRHMKQVPKVHMYRTFSKIGLKRSYTFVLVGVCVILYFYIHFSLSLLPTFCDIENIDRRHLNFSATQQQRIIWINVTLCFLLHDWWQNTIFSNTSVDSFLLNSFLKLIRVVN